MAKPIGKLPKNNRGAELEKARGIAQKNFLKLLGMGWTVSAACEGAGVGRKTVYNWREEYPEFLELWDDAIRAGDDALEQEAYRRAVVGNERPIFVKGERVGEIREYSDNLLMFLLRGRRPERFRERFDVTSDGSTLLTHFAKALLEHPDHGEGPRSEENRTTQH